MFLSYVGGTQLTCFMLPLVQIQTTLIRALILWVGRIPYFSFLPCLQKILFFTSPVGVFLSSVYSFWDYVFDNWINEGGDTKLELWIWKVLLLPIQVSHLTVQLIVSLWRGLLLNIKEQLCALHGVRCSWCTVTVLRQTYRFIPVISTAIIWMGGGV